MFGKYSACASLWQKDESLNVNVSDKWAKQETRTVFRNRFHLHIYTVRLTFAALFGTAENMRKSINVNKHSETFDKR